MVEDFEIGTIWNDDDECVISEVVRQCKRLEEDILQQKLDYYYKPYGLEPESAPMKPMNFDDDSEPEEEDHSAKERFYAQKAAENWRRLADTICNQDTDDFRNLVKSVNAYMYPQLKQFADQIMTPDFQKIMMFLKNIPNESDLNDKMKYAKEGIDMLNQIMGISDEQYFDSDTEDEKEIDEDSLISSLLMIKRSKLEEVVQKITELQSKKKKYRKPKFYTNEIMTEISKKDIPFYSLKRNIRRVKAKSKRSTKTVPIYTPKANDLGLSKFEKERPLHVRTNRRKNTMLSFESIAEDSNSDEDFAATADAANIKAANHNADSITVTSADSSVREVTTRTGKKLKVVCHSSKTPVVNRAC